MSYSYNPHRHVKIWLSKDKNIFLNLENRVRLVKMRDLNPTDEINFIYDSSLLSPKALHDLKIFCTKYHIGAKDVQQDVIPHCQTEEEINLIQIYNDEIANLDAGGNLAVGSDILRWLKPVYELGTYTDFDVHVDTSKLPEAIFVEKPFLISLGSAVLKGDVESICVNNDSVAVVDSQDALPDIQKIQKNIHASCSKQSSRGLTFTDQLISTFRNRLSELLPPFWVQILSDRILDANLLLSLALLSAGKTAREVRKKIIDITENNLIFAKNTLQDMRQSSWGLTEREIIAEAVSMHRAALKQQLGWINWLLLPKNQYKQIKALISMQDNKAFLTEVRELNRMMLLKTSVVYTSGPAALLYALFDKLLYKKGTINKEFSPFSFAHYGLEKAFISPNSLPFHASEATVNNIMKNTEIGKTNDLSWLQEGQNATAKREQKIVDAQSRMPQEFHELREKMETHIEKIKADLIGCLGFYRYKERHAKIHALKCILGHFEKSHFDVDGFKASLDNYRTKDVSASIGKSKTKELIDKLDIFSQQAKHYMLTDENGKVEIQPPTPTTVGYRIQ